MMTNTRLGCTFFGFCRQVLPSGTEDGTSSFRITVVGQGTTILLLSHNHREGLPCLKRYKDVTRCSAL